MVRRSKTGDFVDIADQYISHVLDDVVPSCEWTRKACLRQRLDRRREEDDTAYPYRFDRKAANLICQVVEKLPHIKGVWAKRGEKIKLEPWQAFIYTSVFGWKHKASGLRRFRTAYLEMARKNGKSAMSAPVGLYMLALDRETGGEIYSAATTRDQAKIVWEVAKLMVEREPEMRASLGIDTSAHSIYQMMTASKFQALSAEGNSLDGLNIHCAIVDELHAHRTRKVFDVLETAKAARQQPLLWLITTAGSDRSGICYEQRTYVTHLLDRTMEDDTYFGVIYSIDEGDDWKDPEVWKKANPNLGVSVDVKELTALCRKAEKMPSALSNFLTKHLSVWVGADSPLFDAVAWQNCGNTELKRSDFASEPCWVGVDLAPRHDFCAVAQVFEREGHFYTFLDHYLSEQEVEEAGNAAYPGWAEDGWITTNPGNTTDYSAVEERLRQLARDYQIREVAFDPFSAKQLADRMTAEGFPMLELRGIVQNFSEPTKKLDALIVEGKLHHQGDPVLAWEMGNVVGHRDRKDNVYPVKERPENKIDGAIALIMAMARAIHDMGPAESVYETREMVIL